MCQRARDRRHKGIVMGCWQHRRNVTRAPPAHELEQWLPGRLRLGTHRTIGKVQPGVFRARDGILCPWPYWKYL